MDVIEHLIERAKSRPRTVVLPEGEDPRILHAARRLHDGGIARPMLIGERAALEAAAAAAGVPLDPIESISPPASAALDAYAALYVEGRPKTSERVAKRLLARPLFYAAMAVKAGDADALVAGANQPTARVIEAGLMSVGLAPGIATPSSFFIMAPHGGWGPPQKRGLPRRWGPPQKRGPARLRRLRGQRRAGPRGAGGHRDRLGPERREAARGPRAGGDAVVLHARQRQARAGGEGPPGGGDRALAGAGARDRRRAPGGRAIVPRVAALKVKSPERGRGASQRPRIPRPRRRQHRLQADRARGRRARHRPLPAGLRAADMRPLARSDDRRRRGRGGDHYGDGLKRRVATPSALGTRRSGWAAFLNIDDEACAEVMRRYCPTTKREAVDFALRALAAEPFGVDEARRLRGSGCGVEISMNCVPSARFVSMKAGGRAPRQCSFT